jgi:hypothetical protein
MPLIPIPEAPKKKRSSELYHLLEGYWRDADLHYGPGPHPSGTSQDVHGGGSDGQPSAVEKRRSAFQKEMEEMLARNKRNRATVKALNESGDYPGVTFEYSTDSYGFQVGEYENVAAATYHKDTKTIRMYKGAFRDDGTAKEYMLAHEYQHHIWHEFNNRFSEENQEIMSLMKGEDDRGDWPISMSGKVKPEYKGRWPTYEFYWDKLSSYEDLEKWEELDGVSQYSRVYWQEKAVGELGRWRAINETLAEIAYLEHDDNLGLVDEEWIELYNGIRKLHGIQ